MSIKKKQKLFSLTNCTWCGMALRPNELVTHLSQCNNVYSSLVSSSSPASSSSASSSMKMSQQQVYSQNALRQHRRLDHSTKRFFGDEIEYQRCNGKYFVVVYLHQSQYDWGNRMFYFTDSYLGRKRTILSLDTMIASDGTIDCGQTNRHYVSGKTWCWVKTQILELQAVSRTSTQ
ncbi:uncharacterized protein BX664DRAFT_357350 [Halteromyces radiatus]|uniref:uncharacterized protein n=1 Tax=Halteromyces radiatus TaxID=101107 RepID=UPI00221FCE44|nr:uncharacterized protein BX664DRAFT_357350 [Halteromyces radiatus]KAI8092846.1 hypothetical protein BX664DRAFT_357350 [Halteromyces radiatus]